MPESSVTCQFGPFTLDLGSSELYKSGRKVRIQDQGFRILVMLVERPAEIVTREEIRRRLWPDGTVVEFEHSINTAVKKLRLSLQDSAEAPKYIETVVRRGYRFVIPVQRIQTPCKAPGEPTIEEVVPSDRPDQLAAAIVQTPKAGIRLDSVHNQTHVRRNAYVVLPLMVALAGAICAAVWFRTRTSSPVPELKQRKLTNNSAGNPVGGRGMISPDGKYLAYSDGIGIHLQLIETGESRVIQQPNDFDPRQLSWSMAAWFPSNTGFLVNSRPIGQTATDWVAQGSAIWVVSLAGLPRKLRDNAEAFSVSPKASNIAFGTRSGEVGDREIWLMGPNGEQPHLLLATGDDHAIGGLQWSRDERRFIYLESDKGGDTVISGDLAGSAAVRLASWPTGQIRDLLWLADGRMLYVLPEPRPSQSTCNLWQQRIDPSNGHALDQPKRLTNWAGFCLDSLSASADAKRFVFTRWAAQTGIWIAKNKPAEEFNATPLTNNEGWSHLVDWTSDSESVLFTSDRNGKWEVFRQGLSELNPRLAFSDVRPGGRVSPDGQWYLFSKPGGVDSGGKFALIMRAPLNGGPVEQVTTAKPPVTISCARGAGRFCAIAERSPDRRTIIFSVVDPVGGRGRELARIQANEGDLFWDLSQDGSRIVAHIGGSNHFELVSTASGALRTLDLPGWIGLGPVAWTTDGGFFVSALAGRDAMILHSDLNGHVQTKWRQAGDLGVSALPSPSGKLVALRRWFVSSNVWMIENF
jgi:DNA-binding winged helix-turn-helix (wHTH) protein